MQYSPTSAKLLGLDWMELWFNLRKPQAATQLFRIKIQPLAPPMLRVIVQVGMAFSNGGLGMPSGAYLRCKVNVWKYQMNHEVTCDWMILFSIFSILQLSICSVIVNNWQSSHGIKHLTKKKELRRQKTQRLAESNRLDQASSNLLRLFSAEKADRVKGAISITLCLRAHLAETRKPHVKTRFHFFSGFPGENGKTI